MGEKYLQEINVEEKTDDEKDIELIKSVIKTKTNLDAAREKL